MTESGIAAEESQAGDARVASEKLISTWGMKLIGMVCERCDWRFLLPATDAQPTCPHCFQSKLVSIDEQIDQLPHISPPELVIPATLPQSSISRALLEFTGKIPFAPIDMTPQNMFHRLKSMYLPKWLVDATVKAYWKAEAGFNYQVVSHQDRYDQNRGGWSSQEVEETRIRWEPRLGRLDRTYNNISAPALEGHNKIIGALGEYDHSASMTYRQELIESAFVRLPDRLPQDAWIDAQSQLQIAASEECRQAARADHFRQFSWQPEFTAQNWTLLLLPAQTTFYLDDDGKPQGIMINGQTGQIIGTRRASMKRGQQASLVILLVAVIIFLLSLLLMAASLLLPSLLVIGVIGLVAALVVALGAVIPIATTWWFNHSQSSVS